MYENINHMRVFAKCSPLVYAFGLLCLLWVFLFLSQKQKRFTETRRASYEVCSWIDKSTFKWLLAFFKGYN